MLNSISREWLNFWRRSILCTTLYRNPMQASNSVAHLTNFSFEFFYKIFTEDASLRLLYHGAKRSKMTKNSNQRGGGGGSCLKAGPLEANLVIFGRRRRALIFLFESSWKIWKMTPLSCACAVAITLETQKCRKGHLAQLNLTFY